MKIRMLKQTVWNEQPLRPGDTPEVDERTALRWLARGIAEELDEGAETFPLPSGTDGADDAPKTPQVTTDDTGDGAGADDAAKNPQGNTGDAGGGPKNDGGKTDADLDTLKQKDLAALADKKGITVKAGTTKKQLVNLIKLADSRRAGE